MAHLPIRGRRAAATARAAAASAWPDACRETSARPRAVHLGDAICQYPYCGIYERQMIVFQHTTSDMSTGGNRKSPRRPSSRAIQTPHHRHFHDATQRYCASSRSIEHGADKERVAKADDRLRAQQQEQKAV
eukprot:6208618-Pleurochrysis_carterae.AAC.4